jgi:hypothetical protein
VRAAAERVLRANWREGTRADGVPYAFTCPAPGKYVHQWYWDSCFHAIVWREIDPERARAELRTLVRAMTPAGLVPHTVFWAGRARWRRAPLYATATPFGSRATAHTQTPVLALAWEHVADGDAEFEREGIEPLARHYERLDRERDPDGDGLIAILFPDESGIDDSPKYDPVYGWLAHWSPGYFWLVERHRRRGYSARAIFERFDHHVEDVLVNVFYALSLRALHRMSGLPRFLERAERVEAALMERSWDERRGLFFDVAESAPSGAWRCRPGPRSRRLRSRCSRSRRAGGWATSTCSIRAATPSRSASRRSRWRSRAAAPGSTASAGAAPAG